MSGSLDVRKASAKSLAIRHDDAAAVVDRLGETAPTGVDGGLGQAALLSILGTLATEAAGVAAANGVVAGAVRQALRTFEATDGADAAVPST